MEQENNRYPRRTLQKSTTSISSCQGVSTRPVQTKSDTQPSSQESDRGKNVSKICSKFSHPSSLPASKRGSPSDSSALVKPSCNESATQKTKSEQIRGKISTCITPLSKSTPIKKDISHISHTLSKTSQVTASLCPTSQQPSGKISVVSSEEHPPSHKVLKTSNIKSSDTVLQSMPSKPKDGSDISHNNPKTCNIKSSDTVLQSMPSKLKDGRDISHNNPKTCNIKSSDTVLQSMPSKPKDGNDTSHNIKSKTLISLQNKYTVPEVRDICSYSSPSSKESSPAPVKTLPPSGPSPGKGNTNQKDAGPKSSNRRRVKKMGKRGRSDGFVLGLDLANTSDEEGGVDSSSELSKSAWPRKSSIFDPEALNFIFWLRNPNVQNFASLRKAIRCNDHDWMQAFLDFDGLGLLFQCLTQLSSYQSSTHLTDMVLRMSCVSCIREVINSRSGLDCLLAMGNRSDNLFGRRFASAMESDNLMVKMQIFELLSALCVYSSNGFYLTLDALERYKLWRKNRYRFSLLVSELTTTDLPNYQVVLMALINSIIVASESLRDRVRIRSEFVALNIIDVIGCLRLGNDDADLKTQLDVFEEELVADTDAMRDSVKDANAIDLSCHHDLFKTIYSKVHDSSLGLSFLSILYNLYQIDPSSPHSESTWILVERLTQQAVEGSMKADRLMEEAKLHKRSVDAIVQTQESASPASTTKLQRGASVMSHRPDSASNSTTPDGDSLPASVPPPPPPPPLPPPCGPPPPPPLPTQGKGGPPPPPPPPPPLAGPGGQSPNMSSVASIAPATNNVAAQGFISPPTIPSVSPIVTPDPDCKMKHFTWNKVPALQVEKTSIWGEVNEMDEAIPLEYDRLKELFAQKVAQQDLKVEEPTVKLRASSSEISLLDPKRSMNVNIFLKQFRKNNAAIIDMIRKGEARNIGVEKLKGLIKILPQTDEIELIQNFDGDSQKLGNAESFFLKLSCVPHYKLRLELMLLKSDFHSQMSNTRTNLAVFTGLCRRLQDNKGLKKFLRLVLQAGNYINKGSCSGEAVGFRMSSLNKLALTKSNEPNISLLHVLVEEAEAKDKNSVEFVDTLLDDLHKASRFSLDQVKSEFHQIKSIVKKLQSQVSKTTDAEIGKQFGDFLEEADSDLLDIEETLAKLQEHTSKLAKHFCENVNAFNFEEFLGAFREFCDRIKQCQQDIQSKKTQAEKAEMRKRAHEEMLEKRRSSTSVNQSLKEPESLPLETRKLPGMVRPLGPAAPGDSKIVDNLVNEIRRGNVLRRLSVRRKTNAVPDV